MASHLCSPILIFLVISVGKLADCQAVNETQITNSIQNLKIFTSAAWQQIISHCQDTKTYINATHTNSAANYADCSHQFDLASPVTSIYFNYVTKTFSTIRDMVNGVLGLALSKLETDLKPWTSKELLQSIVNNVGKVVEEVSGILVEFGEQNQRRLALIHNDAVRKLWALQMRYNIFIVSQYRQWETIEIIDIAKKEVQKLLEIGQEILRSQFDIVVGQLLTYFREVLNFASENEEIKHVCRVGSGFEM